MVKITVLSDNYSNAQCPEFLTEHGYSLYIEFQGLKILVDTGASDNFLKNAEKRASSRRARKRAPQFTLR